MYSYKPSTNTLFHRSLSVLPPQSRVSNRVALLCVALFLGGLLVARLVSNGVYVAQTKDLAAIDADITLMYQEKVARSTNVNSLAKAGAGLLKKNMPGYAAMNFKQAATLDKNYRDAAYGWAYSVLQSSEFLDTAAMNDVRQAIAQAEAVDPLYVPLLELKLIVAQIENNPGDKTAAEARLEALKTITTLSKY